MFASHYDRKKYKKVCIIDANSKIGEKIKISGGGKCNITNEFLSHKNYLGDEEFLKELFTIFSKDDLLSFLNKNQVFTKLDPRLTKGTYFCKSSSEVISMFTYLTKDIKKYLNTKVLDIEFNTSFNIITQNQIIKAKKVIIASGGLSYPKLNSSGFAYEMAKKFGHSVSRCEPALVGFTVQKEQFWFKNLSGISVMVDVFVNEKKIEGSLLFTHKGCSGPVILTSSLYWKKGKIVIDFLPKQNIEKFLKGNKKLSSSLSLPKRFIQEFLISQNIEDKAVSSLNSEDLEKLKLLKYYEFSPAGNFGFSKAEVTKGGINTDEINHKTFESLKQKGLYFLGECLDITGELGGFNFQFAFSSAVCCARNF